MHAFFSTLASRLLSVLDYEPNAKRRCRANRGGCRPIGGSGNPKPSKKKSCTLKSKNYSRGRNFLSVRGTHLSLCIPRIHLVVVYHPGFIRFIRQYEKQTDIDSSDRFEGLLLAPYGCTKVDVYVEAAKSDTDIDYISKRDKAIRTHFLENGFDAV